VPPCPSRTWHAPVTTATEDSKLSKVLRSDITLGQPLPYSIFDERGLLLLRAGIAITLPSQIDRLVARNAVWATARDLATADAAAAQVEAPPRNSQPVFDQVDSLISNLKHALTTAIKTPEQIDLPARIAKIATAIQLLCGEDLDGALAAPQLDAHNPYIVVHQVMGAILTEVMGWYADLSPEQRLPLVCAALTRDIGQLTLQSEIDKVEGPLPEVLKAAMREHPRRSQEILARAGVNEAAWLEAVLQHHERLDGSGYPLQLRADAVGLGGRMLAIADSYSAMTKPRPYRNKEMYAQNALRDIYLQKDTQLDGGLTQSLIKEIGMLPPGSIVRLKCGEIAAVKHRAMKTDGIAVYSVYNQKGMPLMQPVRRETSTPGFEIAGMVPFSECRSAAVTIKRLWLNEFKI
jgi:hypothetical protein